jgi:hypothetical protein
LLLRIARFHHRHLQRVVGIAGRAALVGGSGAHPCRRICIRDRPPVEQILGRGAVHQIVAEGIDVVIGQTVFRLVAHRIVDERLARAIGPEFLRLSPQGVVGEGD